MNVPDRELKRLHRRACTDFAARMRLPAWEHLLMPLAAPLNDFTVKDLLLQVVNGNVGAAASLSGQPAPALLDVDIDPSELLSENNLVIESVRTVITVVSGLDVDEGFSPARRELLWTRVVELTVLGYDLQQTIMAGAGLDDLLVDRVAIVQPDVHIWPNLDPIAVDVATLPAQRVLAMQGRPAGLWVDASDPSCSTGQC
ncbi:MAG: hypothetical protein ACI8Y4_002891 [Candidatus Poriferisodalaceae bacterium]|jgi:hypothetical protein